MAININQKIVLKNSYDYNINTVINHLIHRLYKIYDINTVFIESWLNSIEFQQALTQIELKCFNMCTKTKNTLLNKLQNITNCDTFVDSNLSWEKDKCGYILAEYNNGYIKYCNCHKYLHNITQQKNNDNYNDAESKHNVNKKSCTKDMIYDHVFSEKTSKEIVDEQIFKLRYNMYLNYTRLMIKELHNLFDKMINDKYTLLYVPIKHKNKVHAYLLTNQDNFREKSIKYQTDCEEEYIGLYVHGKQEHSEVNFD